MNSAYLLDLAWDMIQRKKGSQQNNLKRAISLIYYAVFHALCQSCADCLVNDEGGAMKNKWWTQVYRSIDHGQTKVRFQDALIAEFPVEIQDLGCLFIEAQEKRCQADYNPRFLCRTSDVCTMLRRANHTIERFNAVHVGQRRSLAAFVALKKRGF